MSPAQCLRELVTEQLTAAADQILRVYEKSVAYEEEIDRLRRLLDMVWRPERKLHRTQLPQQHVCKEEEVLSEQQLCDQERNSSLDQEEPEPPQMKEEQGEPVSSQEGEQLVLKQEAETFMLTPTHEESEHSEPEPNSDQQLLSHYSPVAESQDQRGSEPVEPGSTRNERTKTKRNKQCYNICNNCGKRFNQKTHLIKHLKIHTDEMPFTCESCGRAFRQSVDWKIHMRTHWGVKPYPCNTCWKRFMQQTSLNNHARTHTGEKPYPCNTCGKRFIQQTSLNNHARTHTGEKPYPCNTCGKRFVQKASLNNHKRTHTGEKPYPCNACGKRFIQNQNLEKHVRLHTD